MPVKPAYLFILLVAFGICYSFSQNNKRYDPKVYAAADKLYEDAERLSAAANFDDAIEAKQDELNRKALAIFKQLATEKPTAAGDSILFQCNVKTGLLLLYFDSGAQAKPFYQAAIAYKDKLPQLRDSFLFQPYLFTGSIYYGEGHFDSALLFYKKAEEIAARYDRPLEELERLYNRVGVMHYEAGNYRLANNYFQKAISLLSPANPSYADFLVNYKMNMASILIKLEEYDKADTILQSILPLGYLTPVIHHNAGIIRLRTGRYAEALEQFRQVKYSNDSKSPELLYNMAKAFAALHKKDSVQWYIDRSKEENARINSGRKNASLGLVYKFEGDRQQEAQDFTGAVESYQKAIGQFYPAFTDTNVIAVPKTFSGIFSYIQLFRALIGKADAFEKLYRLKKERGSLEAAFNAYKSAFELADHVATSYDSDEARLFISRIKYAAHDKSIGSSLALYELTQDKKYLEEAYFFDQRNKAASLTMALQENNRQRKAGISSALKAQQANYRSAITRLSIKASRITDSAALAKLNREIIDNEIGLSRLLEQIKNDPAYSGMEAGLQIPSIQQLQTMLDGETGLLSYHLSTNSLVIFTVSKNNFSFTRQATDSNFNRQIAQLLQSLHGMGEGKKYAGAAAAASLYNTLIKPVAKTLPAAKRLIIIPDDELNYIPFEALEDEKGAYLLQSYAVQYQFSTALLQVAAHKRSANDPKEVLGFAPFTETNANGLFASLPYSKEELSAVQGKIFYGSEAGKQQFIEYANRYPVIQLATHAAANDTDPQRSYIAFYPHQKDSADQYMLYAQEIYGLNLDSTELVILSACETGGGQLVKGEGLMSITRAFSYAGCPNIITSLWKATDKTTAFITQRLHVYLDKGLPKDKALQMAKLDLLESKDIPPALKAPGYWAHLIFIGDYEPAQKSYRGWYYFAGIAGLLLFVFLAYKKMSRQKAGRGFSKEQLI